MDDNYLDTLITRAAHSRAATAQPSDEFFASIAMRGLMSRRRRIFRRISAAASVCLVAAAGVWFFSSRDRDIVQPSAGSHLYSESVDNASERIERLASVQADLRQSIDSQFPF